MWKTVQAEKNVAGVSGVRRLCRFSLKVLVSEAAAWNVMLLGNKRILISVAFIVSELSDAFEFI